MREFLSEHRIPFEDRNIRKDPAARESLLALTGELSVPLLIVGDEHILGFDQPAMARALGLAGAEGR